MINQRTALLLFVTGCAIYGQALNQPNKPSKLRPDALSTIWSFDTYTATHLVDGTGWSSEVTLMNLDSTQQCFSLNFFGNNGSPLSMPLVDYGTQSSVRLCLQALGSVTLKTAGTSSPLVEGWARLACDSTLLFCVYSSHIAGSVIFRRSIPGQPDFEAVVPFDDNSSSHLALPFDNTNGFLTGLALTNPTNSQAVVTFIFHAEDGTQIFVVAFSLSAGQHMSFVVPWEYPQVASRRGVLEITSTAGIGVLALRVNPTGAITTMFPVTSGSW